MEEVKKQEMGSLFVPYEIALALNELGFDEPCIGFFNIKGKFIKDFGITKDILDSLGIQHIKMVGNICLAPTFSQCFRWFREKYDMDGIINTYRSNNSKWYSFFISKQDKGINNTYKDDNNFTSHEEAELECLVKLIDIIKKQNLKG